MRLKNRRRLPVLYLLSAFLLTMLPLSAFAQGSIFGTVTNSDASTPANGEITFFGFLDDTDEELRIETSTGAGYDAGNWFDDFQNYLTEAPGNPYDYYFFNTANGEGAHLGKLMPNNSFQQENILLAAVAWPVRPAGLAGRVVSSTSLVLEWNYAPGLTYHVYRRAAASNGSFFRLDNPAGSLSNPGTADSFFVDNTVDGVSSYDYLVIAQDGSGNLSQHSDVFTISSAGAVAPTIASITPNTGFTIGGAPVIITGSGFDMSGAIAFVGSSPLTNVVVVSPYQLTGTTGTGTAGAATVTVTNVAASLSGTLPGGFTYVQNSPPVLATIGPKLVAENSLLTINATATDADLVTPIMSTSTLPPGAAFVDNGDGSGTFTWTPTYLQSGVYNVTFYATDGAQASFVDSERVAITVVDAGNQPPVLAAIGPKSTTENVLLTFSVSATDIESVPVLSTSALPGSASFNYNGDGTGTFSWTPSYADAGSYPVTFYATDDSSAVDSEVVTITVLDAGNQPPVLAAIGSQGTTENTELLFVVTATDPDGTYPTVSTSPLPATATFVDHNNGTGTFDWTPSFTDAGTYNVTFYASDGLAVDSEQVVITVTDAGNQPPVLAAIGPQGTTEGVLLNFTISATDADGTIPTFNTSALPGTASFVDNGDGTATFDWTPAFNSAGVYPVTFRATDGIATDSEIVTITVLDAGNQAPVLAAIGPQSGTEAVLLTFGVSAIDPDGTTPSLLTSALPGTATFLDNGDGTGTFTWTPGYTDAGSYDVSFFASDGVALDTEIVTITIADAGNQAPVLAAIGPQGTAENVQLLFTVTASDLDGTIPVLSTSALPGTATFNDNLDGSGTFDWTPAPTMAGTYDVTFYATDGIATDSEIVTITVTDVNQPPVLAAIGPQTVDEGTVISIPVSATDIDGVFPVLTTSALPTGAAFVDNADGTGSFTWATTFDDAGVYNVTFYATDGAVPTAVDSEAVVITINDVNRPPVLLPIATQTVAEGATLSFTTSATDLDGDIPIMTSSALPGTATYVDNGDGTGSFNWVTDFSSAGIYPVTFYATDALYPTAIDSEIVSIVVGDAGNQPPQFTQLNDTTVAEGATLVLNVSALDYEGDSISLSINTTLQHYTFVDHHDGTGTLTYTPGFYDAGLDTVRFIATDNATPPLSKIMKLAVTTTEVNQPPSYVQVGPFAVDALDSLVFAVRAYDSTDQSSGRLYLSVTDLPANAAFADNGDNTGIYRFAPTLAQVGTDTVHFIVVDDGTPARTGYMSVIVRVRNVDQPPVLDPIGSRQVLEGNTLVVNLSATDPDGTIPFFEAINAPTNSNLVDNGDGTAVWTFSPSFVQSGLKYVTFRANDGELFDKEVVVIQVIEAGDQAPYFSVLPSPTVLEGETTTDTVVAVDPDGQIPTISVEPTSLPTNMSFSSIGDGMGEFIFSPDFTQSGVYIVTVIATAGDLADTVTMDVTVQEFGNHDPVMAPLTDKTTTELRNLSFTVTASDIDGVPPVLSISGLPTGATFDVATGGFSWTPTIDQQGDYPMTFYAYDGDPSFPNSADSQQITVTVVDTNRVPQILPLPNQVQDVNEGSVLQYIVTAWDLDGTTPVLSAHLDAQDTLATNMVFVDSGNGVGVLTFSPGPHQGDPTEQKYYVRFVATDELDPTLFVQSGTQTFTVHNVPLPPTLTFSAGTGPFTLTEGQILSFTVTAVDPDGLGIPSINVVGAPANATYSQAINVLTFNFAPSYSQAGTYNVQFIGVDPDGVLKDTVAVQINVLDAGNQAPYFTGTYPTNQAAYVGVLFTLDLTAVDPDNDSVVISAASALLGWSLIDHGDGTATFALEADVADAGTSQQVTFTVTDVPAGTSNSFVINFQVLTFLRGDIDNNQVYSLNDVVYLAAYLFRGGPPPSPLEAADADLNGAIQVSDLVYMVNFLYNAGPRPPQ